MCRALAAATSAVVIAVGVLVLAAPSPASAQATQTAEFAEVEFARYGGADRYATSLLVAEAYASQAGGTLDSVVLVSGLSWRSAVMAAPLAGKLGAPVLMTPPDRLRDDAKEFLVRVGVTEVYLVGTLDGPESVSTDVWHDLELASHRVNGVLTTPHYVTALDTYWLASAVSRHVAAPGEVPGFGRTAIVASGEVFADALVAGPFAAFGQHPVLLTPPDELHSSAAAALVLQDIEHVVIMGGEAAVSESVEQAIIGRGIQVTRLAGRTRYGTAIQAARFVSNRYTSASDEECFTSRRIGIARARVPFDSFSAAPLLGLLCAPLVLSDPDRVQAFTADYLDTARELAAMAGARSLEAHVFGGEAAVSEAALIAYRDRTYRWRGVDRWDRQFVGIDTWDRDAVLAAYKAEFDRPHPDWGYTGDVGNCVAGTTSQEFRDSVVQRVNWFRAMAGVEPIAEDPSMSESAQAKALIMAAAQMLDHRPPDDWPCYSDENVRRQAGAEVLHLGPAGLGAPLSYMRDHGDTNLAVGHRRILTHPRAREMGTGDHPRGAGRYWGSNAIHIDLDYARHADMREPRHYVAWPPPGYVPYTMVWGRWSFEVHVPDSSCPRGTAWLCSVDVGSVAVSMSDQSGLVGVEVISRGSLFGGHVVWAVAGDTNSFRHPKPVEGEHCYTVTISGVVIEDVPQDPYEYRTCVIDPDADADAEVGQP